MPDQIFISYRRDDAAYVTGHINDLLRREFGDEAVFTDVDNIALGVDFRAVLDQTVSQCQVFLAVIGSEWLTVKGHDGQPRLQDPADFVRIEIESALERNIPVIPLLVSGATMPAAEDLPESLQGLAFRNGTPIRPGPDFGVDIARLIKNLRRHFDSIRAEPGDGPGLPATTDPDRDSEKIDEQPPADVASQRESQAKQSETSGVSVRVAEDERARKRAEFAIGQQQAKKWWSRPLGLIAIVTIAGASWYYVNQNLPTVQAVLTAIQTANTETGESVDASIAGSTGEAEPGEESETGLDVDASAGNSAEPVTDSAVEPEPDTAAALAADISSDPTDGAELAGEPEPELDMPADVTVTAMDETTTESASITEPAAEATTESAEEQAADAEVVDEVASEPEAGPAENVDTADAAEAEIVRTPLPDPSELIREGVRQAGIGRHEAAILIFDEAIQLDVEPAFVYRQRGASYQALGKYEAAISDYGQAIQLNGEDLNAYYNRGSSHLALEDYEAAIADFDVVIQLDPDLVDAYSKRADAHDAIGNIEAAALDRTAIAEFESKRDNPR